MIKIEVACNSYASCLNAAKGGADRIELFENLQDGGCTPSAGTIRKAITLDIPVYVMIRPRGGDFVYSKDEIDIMMSDIEFCKIMGVKGIVFGCLKNSGEIDTDICKKMLKLWDGPATFHRAIDRTADVIQSAKLIADLGFERILSSGGAENVVKGIQNLKRMNSQLSSLISIMPGAGVTRENAAMVVRETGVTELHSTCKESVQSNNGCVNENFNDFVNHSSEKEIKLLRESLIGL